MASDIVRFVQSPEVVAKLQKANRSPATAEQVCSMIALAVGDNGKLAACTPRSIIKCAAECVGLGLVPDGVSGQAYLVPYKDVCTLIVGYRGFIQLAYRSDQISVWRVPEIVWEGDLFQHYKGDDERIRHEPCGNRERMIGVYNIVELTNGGRLRLSMMRDEIETIKKRSRSAQASFSPWHTDEPAMWMKCPVRRLAKFVPTATELQRAVSIDEAGDTMSVEQFPGQLEQTPSEIAAELTGTRPDFDPSQIDPETTELDPPSEADFLD